MSQITLLLKPRVKKYLGEFVILSGFVINRALVNTISNFLIISKSYFSLCTILLPVIDVDTKENQSLTVFIHIHTRTYRNQQEYENGRKTKADFCGQSLSNHSSNAFDQIFKHIQAHLVVRVLSNRSTSKTTTKRLIRFSDYQIAKVFTHFLPKAEIEHWKTFSWLIFLTNAHKLFLLIVSVGKVYIKFCLFILMGQQDRRTLFFANDVILLPIINVQDSNPCVGFLKHFARSKRTSADGTFRPLLNKCTCTASACDLDSDFTCSSQKACTKEAVSKKLSVECCHYLAQPMGKERGSKLVGAILNFFNA
ncbi:hypothetical protein EGR_06605 [Echinococcus granulosus]|uniref:Uncharacterized protein n=1 Tax=Echinococcus granulosus TaxID=6210 RepID=W6UCR1_ECHGR|nr:hypothetical protein EGR_06605 [Echinococcus granulosus]EUB58516.1 hypothetical protein EGR_06605 [Echinococcus granulosus]